MTATPKDGFTADMLEAMTRAVNEYQPAQSLFVSRGWRDAISGAIPIFKMDKGPSPSNPLFGGYTTSYQGFPVDVVGIPPEEVLDWSGCRSPARAKRRHAKGIPQRVKITHRERAYLVDRKALADAMMRRFERMATGALYGVKE